MQSRKAGTPSDAANSLTSNNGEMKWNLVIVSSAAKELRRVPSPELTRINNVFSAMCANPFSGDVKSLRGTRGALRRREGDWRILFDLRQKEKLMIVLAVRRRGSKTY